MQIGTFQATGDGFAGRLNMLAFYVELTLVPTENSDNKDAPDYRVLAGDWGDEREIGAGWKRTGDKAGAYVAVQIDDPTFIAPVRANLFQGEGGTHILVWSRAPQRSSGN